MCKLVAHLYRQEGQNPLPYGIKRGGMCAENDAFKLILKSMISNEQHWVSLAFLSSTWIKWTSWRLVRILFHFIYIMVYKTGSTGYISDFRGDSLLLEAISALTRSITACYHSRWFRNCPQISSNVLECCNLENFLKPRVHFHYEFHYATSAENCEVFRELVLNYDISRDIRGLLDKTPGVSISSCVFCCVSIVLV